MSEIIIVPANGRVDFSIPAKFIHVQDVSIVGAVFTMVGHGDDLEIREEMGKGSKLSFLPEAVTDWEIINVTNTQLSITIKAGLVYYEEDTVVGDVNSKIVNDLKNDKVIAGESFSAFMLMAGTINDFQDGIGNYAAAQLFNPVGSGRTLQISNIKTSCNLFFVDGVEPDLDYVTFHCYLLQTEILEVNKIPQASATNKNPSGPVSVASLRGTVNAARTYNTTSKIHTASCETVVPGVYRQRIIDKDFIGGILVPEGYGLTVENTGAVNNRGGTLSVSVEYEEY